MATFYICLLYLFNLCVSNLYLPDLGRSLLFLSLFFSHPPLFLPSFL